MCIIYKNLKGKYSLKNQNIGAIHHSEERYSSLTLIAYSLEQRERIQGVINHEIKNESENINISESEVDEILETTVEFHDDYDKKSGAVFNNILKSLDIKECN